MADKDCYRIPVGVCFERWAGDGEWVIYHSGTGETLRISEAALAILDLLEQSERLDSGGLDKALSGMLDEPSTPDEMQTPREELLRVLLGHECVERVACD